MLGNGVINAVGQYWWTCALSLAPPSAVGPFYYFMLVWSACVGFCLLGRCADAGDDCRIRGRGRLRFVPAVARDKQKISSSGLKFWEEIDELEYPPRRDRA